uniref:Uncharacterized protein n=1 Tax=Triticum urartu TaxID=4572 RepID=A0A8R7QKL1_TRIUA
MKAAMVTASFSLTPTLPAAPARLAMAVPCFWQKASPSRLGGLFLFGQRMQAAP